MQKHQTSFAAVTGFSTGYRADGYTAVGQRPSYDSVINVVSTKGDFHTGTPYYLSKSRDTGVRGTMTLGFNRGSPQEWIAQITGQLEDSYPYARFASGGQAQNIAYNKCIDDLSDKVRGSLDVSIDLAQLSLVRDMLNPVQSLVRTLQKSKDKSKTFTAINSVKNVSADAWLQYQYGWKPTMQTVYDLVDNFQRGIHRPFYVKARGRFEDSTTYGHLMEPPAFQTAGGQLNSLDVGPDEHFEWDVKFSSRCQIILQLQWNPNNHFQNQAAFTSLNPLSIAWELMPYSFVYDWFFHIGDYLRSLETQLLYQSSFVRGWKTTTHKVSWKAGRMLNPGHTTVNVTGSGSFLEILRSPLQAYPLPLAPRFHVDLGADRLKSAAALLSQFVHLQSKPPFRSKRRNTYSR